jgi:rhamnogalacturonyl hydrolase YesR
MGLFPISYLARAEYHNESYADFGENWQIVANVARLYVLPWPERLSDGTISRAASWPGQPQNNLSTFLWSDDQFMGIALLARAARNAGLPRDLAATYADFCARQQVSFASHMQDPSDGLFFHGYNAFTNETSCCKWGRANGWVMMAHAEVYSTLTAVAPNHPLLPQIAAIWRAHAAGMRAAQGADGRWHQVLDDASTYLETSVTAMAVYSLSDGVLGGALDRATFAPVVEAAWAGAAAQVQADGTVDGICEGTGIGADVAFYQARSTAYGVSDPGIGSVFRAALAYDRFAKAAAAL